MSNSKGLSSGGKGWTDRYKSREYLENHKVVFGERCIKHCRERLPCKRCEELKDATSTQE